MLPEDRSKRRCLIALALACAGCLGAGANNQIAKPPAYFPFPVNEVGAELSFEFDVSDHRYYYFDIHVPYREKDLSDFQRAEKLVQHFQQPYENSSVDRSDVVEVRLTVTSIDRPDVRHEWLAKPRLIAQGSGRFRTRAGQLALRPGRYQVAVRCTNAVPALSEAKTSFGVTWDLNETGINK